MRGNKFMGILWIIIAVCLIAILVYKLSDGNKRKYIAISDDRVEADASFNPSQMNKSYTFSTSEFNAVDIQLSHENLYVSKSADDKVYVELYTPVQDTPKVNIIGNTLKIESEQMKIHFGIFGNRKVVIKLPANIELSDFDADVTSGSVHIDDQNLEQADIKSASGSIHMNNCKFYFVDLRSQSGSVNIQNCTIDELEAKSSSGGIKAAGDFNKLDLHAISGSVNVTVSTPFTKDSDIQSTSGSVHLSVPADSGMNIKYSCVSGTYHNKITDTSGKRGNETVNAGGPKVELRTTSGSIYVN